MANSKHPSHGQKSSLTSNEKEERSRAYHTESSAESATPVLWVVFSVNPEACNLSGDPPFKFEFDITSSSDQPITVSLQRAPLGACLPKSWGLNCVDELVQCFDVKTGEEVEFPSQFGCWDENPWPDFPPDDQFVEILPQNTLHFEYTLDRLSNSTLGGLESLESGRQYRAYMARQGVGIWMFGRKEELLKGDAQEKEQRWKRQSQGREYLRVEQVNDPVVFNVVD
jgi:hypothetical protein